MNKKEAAAYLGLSTRAVERHVKAGRLHPTHTQGRYGVETVFDQADLDQFKTDRSQPVVIDRSETHALAPRQKADLTQLAEMITSSTIESLSKAVESFATIAQHDTVRLSEKLMLTYKEASELSGLTVNHLRVAVRERKLRAIHGRVKAAELRKYVDEL